MSNYLNQHILVMIGLLLTITNGNIHFIIFTLIYFGWSY